MRTDATPPPDWLPEIDVAVQPVFERKFVEARANLEALNITHPNNYYIHANLGAVCELAGEDATALSWVEKAIQLKPDAHYGTEWIHLAVLRAKLALVKDPGWLAQHTITGIPVEGDIPPDFSVMDGTRRLGPKKIQLALVAHAVPRLLFVKPQDPIAAALLTELARVEARVTSIEAGLAMLDLADEYGAKGTSETRQRWLNKMPSKFVKWLREYHLPISFSLGGILMGYLLIHISFFRAKRLAMDR